MVVLALWYGTNIEVAKQLADKLKGKTVVDIANPGELHLRWTRHGARLLLC